MAAKKLSERARPSGVTRIMARLPLLLFKARLGFFMGKRFLRLRHVGRKSGKPRETVLEVVQHEAQTNTYYVCSGWGARADWFRNLLVTPDVTIQVGSTNHDVHAERLGIDEAAGRLADYAREHSTAFRNLAGMMLGEAVEADAAGARQLAEHVPMVALQPR